MAHGTCRAERVRERQLCLSRAAHDLDIRAGDGASDRHACCAASHRGDPGLGPFAVPGLALNVADGSPGTGLGKEVGTPGTPCLRMHSE